MKKTKDKKKKKNEIINLDNEIIIGLTPKKEDINKKRNTSKNTRKTKKIKENTKKKSTNKSKQYKDINPEDNKDTQNKKRNTKKGNKKNKRKTKIIKLIMLSILIVLAIILFLMSSVFNIREIVVTNNNKISTEEIINLSTLTKGTNMFKITNKTIKNGVKNNAYIDDVKINRKINGTVTLKVTERIATYMLKLETGYMYINNQGYMLEISEEKLEVPIISGFSTPVEEIKVGNRLNVEDLNKLDDVNKIIRTSESTAFSGIITEISILSLNDYRLWVESEEKTVKLGDISNINIKLQMAANVFEREKGKKGEIYFQNNTKKAVFKEEV